jgi:Flp pilus assembly protein TadG
MSSRNLRSSGSLRRSGAATLELALTLSILFSICYGTIEYGYYFFVKNTMQGAVREGCRAGIVSGAVDSSVTAAAINQLYVAGLITSSTTATGSGPYTIGNYTLTISPDPFTSMLVGNTLTVTMTATWGVVGQNFRPEGLIAASKIVTTASSMRKEGD